MNQLNTEREQRFIDLAATLADEFAPRAAKHDEEGSFPYENYARLKETGYTVLTIPEKLGGFGASLLERIKAQERLARGCGATALAINMHFNTVGLLIDLYRKFQAPNVERMLRRIASDRLICGGSGSEPDNAVINLRPRTTATRVEGGWIVNGRKIFSTQSIALDLFFAEAISEDAPQGPTIITFFIPPRETPGLTFKDDWNVMGMRATASNSSELKDARVPDEYIVLTRPVSRSGRVTKVFAKAPFTIGAPYIGIAAAARDFTVEFMKDRRRFPLKHPMSHLPAVYNKVGEMDLLLEGARAAMWKAAGEVDRDDPRSWSRKAVAARMIAVENSVRVVDLALRAVGGSSYFKRLPLERLFRDVRAGLYHPFDSDESIEFLGKSAFGIPLIEGLDVDLPEPQDKPKH
ncbi:MAG TPA: acyl-CoA dehydrogenase family protein [Candidatus Binataceae bacterium]|nr:acyl-CoA dehydrogenase family protein [Candidatus Binataceae bacterium]